MKKLNKFVCAIFAQSGFAVNTDPSNHVNEASLQNSINAYIKSWTTDAYSGFYLINSIDVTPESLDTTGSTVESVISVKTNKVLKVKRIDELPFVKGMLRKANVAEISDITASRIAKANSDTLSSPEVNQISKVLNDWYRELKDYIGQSFDSYNRFRLDAQINADGSIDETSIKLYVDQMGTYQPAETLIPETSTDMFNDGVQFITQEIVKAKQEAGKVHLSSYSGYDRLAARDYANTWTSNPPSPNTYDTSYWNTSAYPRFSGDTTNGDCADYVSQALHAGGIPIDPGNWQRLSDSGNSWAWTSVTGLRNYMYNQMGYWNASNFTYANAGGVIIIPDSHTMMIVRNDTATRLYSAHTHDRLGQDYGRNANSGWEYYVLN